MTPSLRFAKRTAAVTGASSGLGAAIASALAAEGAAVVGLARRFPPVRPAAAPAPGRVAEVHLDVTDEADVRARFDELGAIDLLVVCAGQGIFAPVLEARVDDLRAMLEVHVVGAFLTAREALRRMAVRRAGHIVLVSSIAAFRTFTDCAGYSAAKEGLRGLARVLAEEARPHGVRVTGLYPGAIDTPIWDARPGFDRRAMMRPEAVAGLVVDVCARPELAVEELIVVPPGGNL